MNIDNILQRDKKIIWHPFARKKTNPDIIVAKRASAAHIYDENDKKYLDLVSSWWVNIHGHGHSEIAKSIYKQAQELEHVIFAGFTHEPAVKLCEDLREILPHSLARFFFSDNGSTAVEVAAKMAYQYWKNLGQNERTNFMNFDGGYHGETIGAMSISKSRFHEQFQDLFFNTFSAPYPNTWDGDSDIDLKEEDALKVIENYLNQYGDKIAAMIFEPIIQGASGMRICRVEFLQKVIDIARNYGILIIFDEVMTGFGRTGSYFALEQINRIPDFLCISKGITGGFLPLALTITSEDIYEVFLSEEPSAIFMHSHSYTANPIACSAAITSLKLLRDESCQADIERINRAHRQGLELLRKSSIVEKLRCIGTISAFDINHGENAEIMTSIRSMALDKGILIRPLLNTIYLMPPYCITDDELCESYRVMVEILSFFES